MRKAVFAGVVIVGIIWFSGLAAQARPISREEANAAAESFLVFRYPAASGQPALMRTAVGRSALAVLDVSELADSGRKIGFVARLAPAGYMLLSADDECPPVKIYSDDGGFTNLPPGLLAVLKRELLEDLEALGQGGPAGAGKAAAKSLWGSLLEPVAHVSELQAALGSVASAGVPLLSTSWNQNAAYNYYCPPASTGPGGRALAGCVGCAVAQILRYHNRPSAVARDYTYTDSSGSCQGAHSISDAGTGAYAWGSMPNSVTTSSSLGERQAIGRLIYHAAVAVESDFEGNTTSAYPSAVPGAYRDVFSYTCGNYESKTGFTSSEWYDKIQADVDANQPVFYSMWQADWSSGHAVVCDGYRNGNEIHLNLGWSGSGTAWYNIDSVSASGYTWTKHGGVFGITPPSDSYTVSVSASPPAGGSAGGGGTYPAGSSRTVTASANSGYSFANWKEGGTVASSSSSYTFTLNANRSLVASFTPDPVYFTITASASPSGGGSASGGGSYLSGSSRTVTASANSGYSFANWKEGGTVVSSSSSYTFTLNGNRNLVATFTADPVNYAITVSADPPAGGSVGGGGSFADGSTRTVTASANSGYTFASWREGSSAVSASPSYTFTLNGNRNLVAYFTADPVNYTITVSASPAACGSVSGGGSYVSGSTRTVTASANSGYTFANWKEGGAVVSASPGYTFTLTGNRDLTANFAAPNTGAIQFKTAAFSVTEGAKYVYLKVIRTGGASGSASVRYTTANKSALSGQDYTARSGTLTWLSGNASEKTISIPIVNDSITEHKEVFKVILSNAAGAALGAPSVAKVKIAANEKGRAAQGDEAAAVAPVLLRGGPGATNGVAWMETTVTGPGILGFNWRIVTANPGDTLLVLDNGMVLSKIAGLSDWAQVGVPFEGGLHTIRWVFIGDLTAGVPIGAGYLDRVKWEPVHE